MANVNSDHPIPSSSQQPHSTPQPASMQAASPPTKQNLKSWWAGFRKETKKNDVQGNYRVHCNPAAPSQDAFTRQNSVFVSKTPRQHRARFREVGLEGNTVVPSVHDMPDETLESSVLDVEPKYFDCQNLKVDAHCHIAKSRRSPKSFQNGGKRQLRFASSVQTLRSRNGMGLQHQHEHSEASDALHAGAESLEKPHTFWQFFDFIDLKRLAKLIGRIAEQAPGIFGVPLRQSITYANVAISLVDGEGKSYIYGYVPIVVAKCGVYLKEKATNVEGIFRLSGSEKRIKELKTIFDSPERYGKGLDWAGYTVHDAANVLRRYLNLLPEPIVPLDLYDRFREPLRGHTMQAVGDNEGPQLPDSFNVSHAITKYQQLITELPPLNRQLLLYILDLLAVFASKSDENRMNSQNLAAIFQPGMLSHPAHDMAPSEYRLSQDVLIFLIENQDHFLIGMRGTAADEQTVQEVQAGITPPGTPRTPAKSPMIGRSASNASAGADSVRKLGGLPRRNVSVSSRASRQSNGAPSPASPALSHTATGGLNRSNTVPSKRSPGLPGNRIPRNSGSPSPITPVFNATQTQSRGLSPNARVTDRNVSPSSPRFGPTTPIGRSSLAPSSHADSVVASQERLLADQSDKQDVSTPQKDRSVSGFFNRSPTVDADKKQPNKLRKKQRQPSSNPSAQSSTNSLHAPHSALSNASSPAVQPSAGPQEVVDRPVLETIPSGFHSADEPADATPPATQTPRAEQAPQQPLQQISRTAQLPQRPEVDSTVPSDSTVKGRSPPSSVHSHSSFNDQSDADHREESAAVTEQREKRSRWRLSRHRDSSNHGSSLAPGRGLGSDAGAGASTSSVGSASRPRKSFTSDAIPAGSESTLVATHPHSSNESHPGSAPGYEEKKGPLGWIKSKMREKREESKDKEAEKERNKSPPASSERLSMIGAVRGKSMDVKREELPQRIAEEPSQARQEPHAQYYPPPQTQSPPPPQTQSTHHEPQL